MRNPKPSLHARRNPPTRYEKINIDILNTKNKCMRIHRYVYRDTNFSYKNEISIVIYI